MTREWTIEELEAEALAQMILGADAVLAGKVQAEIHTRPPFTLSGPDTHKRRAHQGQPSHKYPGAEYPRFDPSPCNAAKDCEICLLPCLTAMGCRVYVCPYWDRTEQ